MIIEIPGSPRRNGMLCWQIRHERQPDGTLKMRREYGEPDKVLVQGERLPVEAETLSVEPPSHEPAAKISRGVVPSRQQELL